MFFKKIIEWTKVMVWKVFRFVKKLIMSMNAWFELIRVMIFSIIEIIRNPSFIMFSVIALGLGTMGIWIDFLPGGEPPAEPNIQSMNNLSVFTFCIATLGGIAADYFFEEKNNPINHNKGEELSDTLSRHGMFFLWSFSVLTAFVALKDDEGIIYALGSTLVFWLLVNIRKPKFQKIDSLALANLSPDLQGKQAIGEESQIKGKGL